MIFLIGPRHCRAFTCALSGADNSRAPRGALQMKVFFQTVKVGGFVDSCPETLVPSSSNRSTAEWTLVDSVDSKGDSTKSNFALRHIPLRRNVPCGGQYRQ